MSVLSITLVLGYSGRRLHQLRVCPIRRDSRFYPVSDYLLDDLRALRIPTPDFVDVSRNRLRVKYTWAASTDPCRSTDMTRRIRAEVERASQERWLLSKLELCHIGIIERSSETDTSSKSWNVTAASERAQDHGKRARSPSPEPLHQPKRPRITNHDSQRGACGPSPSRNMNTTSAIPLTARLLEPTHARSVATVPRQAPTLLSRISMDHVGASPSNASRKAPKSGGFKTSFDSRTRSPSRSTPRAPRAAPVMDLTSGSARTPPSFGSTIGLPMPSVLHGLRKERELHTPARARQVGSASSVQRTDRFATLLPTTVKTDHFASWRPPLLLSKICTDNTKAMSSTPGMAREPCTPTMSSWSSAARISSTSLLPAGLHAPTLATVSSSTPARSPLVIAGTAAHQSPPSERQGDPTSGLNAVSLKTCQEMAAIEGLSGPVDGAHPDDDVPGDVGDAMAGVRPRHRSSRAGYRAQKVKAQRAVADSVAAQQDGVASPEARPSPAVGNQSQGCSPTVKLDVASTELSLTNTTVSGPAASASGSSHVSSLADPTAVGPPPAQDSGVLHGPLSPVTCADHTPSPADEMVRPTMKAEQPSPSTMSDKTRDETDVAEPMSSAQELRQVDARPSGLFVASSSGEAAADALPSAAGPVDDMVRPAMNVPQHPLPSTPNGNALGAAAGTHPVSSLREEPREVDAEPAVSSNGSRSGLKDQDVMQALEDILDRVTAQGRGEMKIVSDAHAIVLNALNAFFKAGGSGGGDWAARSQ